MTNHFKKATVIRHLAYKTHMREGDYYIYRIVVKFGDLANPGGDHQN